MSTNFWLGLIILVCMLEAIRIALSTYVLIHILERLALTQGRTAANTARESLRSAQRRAQREALVQPTLNALRAAMDELNQGAPGQRVEAAVAALDRYVAVAAPAEARR